MLNETIIRHLYSFRNAPGPAWRSWKDDDDGSPISSGLVVKLYRIQCYDSTGCKKAADNDDFHRSRLNDKCVI